MRIPFNKPCLALRLGKVDAVPSDTVVLRRWAANRPGAFEVVGRFAENPFGFFFRKGLPLRDRANGVVAKMKASGELQRIVSKWCDAASLEEVRFEPHPGGAGLVGRNGTLRFVTNSGSEPGAFVRRGEVVGFDIDIAKRIAGELGMGFEFQDVSENAVVPAAPRVQGEIRGLWIAVIGFGQNLSVYRGEVIGLLKITLIVGYIAICDLTKASDLVRSRTYESFFPIITTALIYFVASWALAFALERVGRRLDPAAGRKGGVA